MVVAHGMRRRRRRPRLPRTAVAVRRAGGGVRRDGARARAPRSGGWSTVMAEHARLLADWLGEDWRVCGTSASTPGWYLTGYPVGPRGPAAAGRREQPRRAGRPAGDARSRTSTWCPEACGPIGVTPTGPDRSTSRTAGWTTPTISRRCRARPTPWSREGDTAAPAGPRVRDRPGATSSCGRSVSSSRLIAPDIDETPLRERSRSRTSSGWPARRQRPCDGPGRRCGAGGGHDGRARAADPRQARRRRRRPAHAAGPVRPCPRRPHRVAVRADGRVSSAVATTRVTMVELDRRRHRLVRRHRRAPRQGGGLRPAGRRRAVRGVRSRAVPATSSAFPWPWWPTSWPPPGTRCRRFR